MRAPVTLSLIGLLAAACGPAVDAPPFRILYPDNRAGAIAEVLQRIGSPAAPAPVNATRRPLVVGATDREVFAFDLEQGRRAWRAELPVASRPIVTPRAVLVLSGDDVAALSIDDGHVLWRVPREESLLGAAATADTVFLAFGTAVSAVASITVRRAGALVAVKLDSGDELWRIETNRQFGAPEVAGDLVLLPWERQYISLFDAATGAERARLRSQDDVITFVRVLPEGVFYGGRGLYRLTPRSAAGTKAGQAYRAVPEPNALPGEPRMGPDGYVPPVAETASEKIRLFWAAAATQGDDLSLAGDLVYYLHYKYVFGIAHADGAVRWATRLPADVVAARATEGGLVVADERGTVMLLSAADGLVRHRSSVGVERLGAAVLDLGAFQPPANAEPTPSDLRARLLEIATDRDNRLSAGRAFAARALAALPEPEVTADLVQIIGRTDIPQVIRDAASTGLEGRTTGTTALVDALGPHYDYLARTQPTAIAAVAAAAGAARERRAVPALLSHLDDPHTRPEGLAAIARALGQIGDRSAIEPLMTFLTRYHADDALGQRPPALAEAAKALVALGARPVHARLQALAADPNALEFVRDSIRSALAGPEPTEATGGDNASATAATATPRAATPPAATPPAATPPAATPPAATPPALPRTLPVDQVQATLGSQLAALRRCVGPASATAPPPPARLRLGFGIVGVTGKAEHLAVTPRQADAVLACLTEVFEGLTFPRFAEPRQRVTFRLETAPPAPAPRSRRPTKRSPPTKAP